MFAMKGSESLVCCSFCGYMWVYIVFFFQFASSLVESNSGATAYPHITAAPVAAALAFGTPEIQPRPGDLPCFWEGTGYPYAGNHAFQCPSRPEIRLHPGIYGHNQKPHKPMASHFDVFVAANTGTLWKISC